LEYLYLHTCSGGSSNTLMSGLALGGAGGGIRAGTPPTVLVFGFGGGTGSGSTGTHSLSLCWEPLDTGYVILSWEFWVSLSCGVVIGSGLAF
jgi:hypothetical protein